AADRTGSPPIAEGRRGGNSSVLEQPVVHHTGVVLGQDARRESGSGSGPEPIRQLPNRCCPARPHRRHAPAGDPVEFGDECRVAGRLLRRGRGAPFGRAFPVVSAVLPAPGYGGSPDGPTRPSRPAASTPPRRSSRPRPSCRPAPPGRAAPSHGRSVRR